MTRREQIVLALILAIAAAGMILGLAMRDAQTGAGHHPLSPHAAARHQS
jgi:zinc transporter ZupT